MAKYIHFFPQDQIDQDEPGKEILWKIDFSLKPEDEKDKDFKISVYDLSTGYLNDSFPLTYLERSMDEMGMEKIYDYPYKKEYYFIDEYGLKIIATLTAMDINGMSSSVKITKKFAEILLTDMSLPLEGSKHPERFLRSLSSFVDFSDKKYDMYERNFDNLLELENLCDKCLRYETNIQWKIINEVIK